MTNTQFSLLDKTFSLVRYPPQHQHKSLQAWDSADELLITHVEAEINDDAKQRLLIMNDEFGSLGCWFALLSPTWVTDSHIANLSLKTNLTENGINWVSNIEGALSSPLTTLTSTEPLPESPTLVLIKIPRALALLEQQLIDIAEVMTPDTQIIASAKVKSITKNVLALFEKYIGETKTSLAAKKSRLVFATPDVNKCKKAVTSPYPTTWQARITTGDNVTVTNDANVFSRQSLDIGARFMLEHMQVKAKEKVIDLGCGNGVLGLSALALAPDCEVTFVDESYMALNSAKRNVSLAFPEQLSQCQFVPSNCLESLIENDAPKVNRILCNPPFHQQNTITDHIAWQMFHDSREMLQKGGHLVVVANRHLDYFAKLKRLFGGVTLIASQNKFVILSAAKR